MSKTVLLSVPLSDKDVRDLHLDDVVYISGEAHSMLYADHYICIMDRIKAGETLPTNFKGGVIYNTGSIYTKRDDGSYDLRALGTTTSSKFNAYTPDFIKLTGIRAIIGKGGMDRNTLAVMKEYGCVYLALPGGCSAVYTPAIDIVDDYWPELTPIDNQRLKFRMNCFGPLLVAMDSRENSIFEQCAQNIEVNLPKIYHRLSIDIPPKEVQ